uniref:Monocarboxylate transporter 14-like n=1 Tax=Crassostrea virginica TaxID=6565 RepID=A0A8B8AP19_CRAVI|nr:monocarboxylate transporter 14-like [Crassostrea virginica]XP_022292384.1 monocarboxylate transporter 14-like [Crassostrea virginica]
MGLYSWLEKKEGGFWGVVVVVAAFMIQIPSFGTAQSFGIYNMYLLRYFKDVSPAAVALIGSINVGVFLGSGPIATFLMNHMSHRKVALLGAVISSAGLIAMPFAPNLVYMYGFYGVLSGLGFCLVYVPSHVLSGLYYDKQRSLATGLATSGSGVGAIIFPLLVNFLVETYGWRGSFYIVCGLSMQNIIFAGLLRPVPEKLIKRYQEAAAKNEEEDVEVQVDDEVKTEEMNQKRSSASALQLLPASSSAEEKKEEEKPAKKSESFVSEQDISIDLSMQEKPDTQNSNPENSDQVVSEKVVEGKESEKAANSHEGSPNKLPVVKQESSDNEATAFCKKNITPRDSLNEVEKLALTKKSTCSILCDYAFIIFFANNIFWNMGVVIILLFGPQYVLFIGLNEQDSALIFSIGGIGAFLGSIMGGLLGNVKNLRLDVAYIVITVLTGVVCLIFPLPVFHSFGGLVFLYVAFAVLSNMIAGLLIVAVAAIVGADAIGTGMGYIMLANGIGSIVAPPLIGWVYEITGRADVAFYIGGSFIILAGLLIILIPVIDHFYLEETKPSGMKPEKIQKECLHVYCM